MLTLAVLFLAATVAGAVNALAGGGGLLTFPLLMTVLSPVAADAKPAGRLTSRELATRPDASGLPD